MVSLVYGSRESISAHGITFLWTNEWDPVRTFTAPWCPWWARWPHRSLPWRSRCRFLRIAMFLTELAPTWLRRPLGTAIEMLAAIPSIIYGMWGLFVFVPLFQEYIQPHVINLFDGILCWGKSLPARRSVSACSPRG